MDAIHLKDLAFFAYHGLYEEEARLGQRFLVDLTCWLDLSAACESDEYEQTVCYAGLVKSVEQAVTGTRFNLIERLAAAIVEAVFKTDERIQKVRVKVEKPGAPLPVPSGTASVEIMRNRPGIT
ncbi:dihydroneopterin aldolase [Roseibium litorale]|uniref:7,8-dihydroneopterin aldolase n=1 Tax=Roseibium litorale TaxID=2803841 RepID=A0ABR9CH77_9HYPH|nr:dihydroneopterin aldolase [Roseibium litorale]MBD8890204.1 dihydroneopterin aldolase [Roseibium litorale]